MIYPAIPVLHLLVSSRHKMCVMHIGMEKLLWCMHCDPWVIAPLIQFNTAHGSNYNEPAYWHRQSNIPEQKQQYLSGQFSGRREAFYRFLQETAHSRRGARGVKVPGWRPCDWRATQRLTHSVYQKTHLQRYLLQPISNIWSLRRAKQKMKNRQSIFLNRGIKLNDLRNRGVNLLVGMCGACTTVGVASVPSNENTLL